MKRIAFVVVAVAVLLCMTLALSEDDFLRLAFKSSTKFEEKIRVPPLPPSPLATTGLAVSQKSVWTTTDDEQLRAYAISSTAVYVEVLNDFVYQYGYVYSSEESKRFALEGEAVNDEWIEGTGAVFLDTAQYEPGNNYFVVYACKDLGTQFDCNEERWLFGDFETDENGLLDPPFAKIETRTNLPMPPPPVGDLG
jgi:hypothetical protein